MGDVIPIGKLRALASTLVSRMNLGNLAGKTFGAKRDLYAALGYKRELSAEDYRARFERNGVAARIVEALPNATWAGDATLSTGMGEETSKFTTTWDELNDRLRIWDKFRRVDILAGLGEFGIILIGAPGDLGTPLPANLSASAIITMSIYAEDDVEIIKTVTDPADPRFGLPEKYNIQRFSNDRQSSAGGRVNSATRDVHWSRVIHVADGILDDEVFGHPRLERVWNLLDDLEKVSGGGAEAFWLRAHQGMQWDLDKDTELSPDELTKFKDQIEKFEHGMQRMVRTRGVEMTALGSDVADFSNPADAVLSQISSASGIPKRILLGSERGELSSTQDRANWNERIKERRSEYAQPRIIRPLVDLFIAHKVLPKATYSVVWPMLQSSTEGEKADIATKWAGLNTATGETVVTGSEIREKVLELPPLSEDDLDSGT